MTVCSVRGINNPSLQHFILKFNRCDDTDLNRTIFRIHRFQFANDDSMRVSSLVQCRLMNVSIDSDT